MHSSLRHGSPQDQGLHRVRDLRRAPDGAFDGRRAVGRMHELSQLAVDHGAADEGQRRAGTHPTSVPGTGERCLPAATLRVVAESSSNHWGAGASYAGDAPLFSVVVGPYSKLTSRDALALSTQ